MVAFSPVDNSRRITSSAVTTAIAPPNNSGRRRCWARLRRAIRRRRSISFLGLHGADRRYAGGYEGGIEGGDRADPQNDQQRGDQVSRRQPRMQPGTGKEEVEPVVWGRNPDPPEPLDNSSPDQCSGGAKRQSEDGDLRQHQ